MNVTATEGFFLGVGLTLFASSVLRWCARRWVSRSRACPSQSRCQSALYILPRPTRKGESE